MHDPPSRVLNLRLGGLTRFARGLVFFLSGGVAAYAVLMYGLGPGAKVLPPEMQANFAAHHLAIHTHIFASALALLLGPLQFSTRLRQRWPRLHRWVGRVYLGGAVLLGGGAGLFMAPHAHGGFVAKLGFAALACAWLYSGLRAYLAVRQRNFVAHRRWMLRNFALTLAAVTLRLYLPLAAVAGLRFELVYPLVA